MIRLLFDNHKRKSKTQNITKHELLVVLGFLFFITLICGNSIHVSAWTTTPVMRSMGKAIVVPTSTKGLTTITSKAQWKRKYICPLYAQGATHSNPPPLSSKEQEKETMDDNLSLREWNTAKFPSAATTSSKTFGITSNNKNSSTTLHAPMTTVGAAATTSTIIMTMMMMTMTMTLSPMSSDAITTTTTTPMTTIPTPRSAISIRTRALPSSSTTTPSQSKSQSEIAATTTTTTTTTTPTSTRTTTTRLDSQRLLKTIVRNRKELGESLSRIQSTINSEIDSSMAWKDVLDELGMVEDDLKEQIFQLQVVPPKDVTKFLQDLLQRGRLNVMLADRGEIISIQVEQTQTQSQASSESSEKDIEQSQEVVIRISGYQGEVLLGYDSSFYPSASDTVQPRYGPIRSYFSKYEGFWSWWGQPYPEQYLLPNMKASNGDIILTGTAGSIWLIYVAAYSYYQYERDLELKAAEEKKQRIAATKKKKKKKNDVVKAEKEIEKKGMDNDVKEVQETKDFSSMKTKSNDGKESVELEENDITLKDGTDKEDQLLTPSPSPPPQQQQQEDSQTPKRRKRDILRGWFMGKNE